MSEKPEKTLKVLEPIQLDVKTFKDKSEFELFFNSHKDEFENSTTTKLNRMYKIPGYRISRVKEQLCLKKDYTKNKLGNSSNMNVELVEELEEKIMKNLEDERGNTEELIEKVNENVQKMESKFSALLVKIKKMENIINQQSETLNEIIQKGSNCEDFSNYANHSHTYSRQ